jgi:hypothetical protein
VNSRTFDNLPALTSAEAETARHALDVYDQHPKGSTPRQINKMMTKLALAYPNAKLSAGEAEARIELYEQSLADIDIDVLGAGFAAAVKSLKFFPAVAELRDLALKQPAPTRLLHQSRLRTLLFQYQRAAPALPSPATVEQIAAVKAELSEEAAALVEQVLAA